MPRQNKATSNKVLAVLILAALAISLVGNFVVNVSVPHDVPVGSAHVSVNVAQAPSRTTGEVTLFVLPRLGS